MFPGTAPGIMFHPIPIIVFNLINEFFLDVAISEELGEHKGIKKGVRFWHFFALFGLRSSDVHGNFMCERTSGKGIFFVFFFRTAEAQCP